MKNFKILNIRHNNSGEGKGKNVFIEDKLVMFMTQYHKRYVLSGDMKIIHRYLLREVGELMIYYLWLILPVVED